MGPLLSSIAGMGSSCTGLLRLSPHARHSSSSSLSSTSASPRRSHAASRLSQRMRAPRSPPPPASIAPTVLCIRSAHARIAHGAFPLSARSARRRGSSGDCAIIGFRRGKSAPVRSCHRRVETSEGRVYMMLVHECGMRQPRSCVRSRRTSQIVLDARTLAANLRSAVRHTHKQQYQQQHPHPPYHHHCGFLRVPSQQLLEVLSGHTWCTRSPTSTWRRVRRTWGNALCPAQA
jgi:hypothetical protein